MIRKSAVPSLPGSVQEYVGRYFKEKEVLGVPCLVAERHTHHPRGSSWSRWEKGQAPSHSVDLMEFGKPDVNEAIRAAAKERPEDLVEVYVEEKINWSTVD